MNENSMAVVYPLQKQTDYTELLFSLRSIEKYLPGNYDVIIVGDQIPGWLTNVTQIESGDIYGKKQLTIKAKIIASFQLAEKIFFMNDDVYLLQYTDAENHPYYHYGDLKNYNEPGTKQLYDRLVHLGLPTKHFDLHYPLVYDRDMFIDAARHFHPDGIVKSMYCNYHRIEGETKWDCKLLKHDRIQTIRDFIRIRSAFSTGPQSLISAKPMLMELFPDKSKYEI